MIVLLSSWAVLVSLRSAFLAGLAAAILLVSVRAFLVPTPYQLRPAAPGARGARPAPRAFRAGGAPRRLQVGPGAALVSPFARKHWLERYRGMILYLDGLDGAPRDEVIAALRRKIPA